VKKIKAEIYVRGIFVFRSVASEPQKRQIRVDLSSRGKGHKSNICQEGLAAGRYLSRSPEHLLAGLREI
jgi:hypothetical protein